MENTLCMDNQPNIQSEIMSSGNELLLQFHSDDYDYPSDNGRGYGYRVRIDLGKLSF